MSFSHFSTTKKAGRSHGSNVSERSPEKKNMWFRDFMLWFAKSQHAKLPIHSRQKKLNMNILSQRLEILETLLSQRCVSKKGL